MMPHISLSAERIGIIGFLSITNALATTWLVMGILIAVAWYVTKNLNQIPSNTQSIAEILIEGLYNFFHSIIGDHIKQIFPVVASLFLFILTANWIGLLPGVGTIGLIEHVEGYAKFIPILRGSTTDLNMTIALAICAVFAIQFFGFQSLGTAYAKRFFNFSNPIQFFVGILEIISDASKIISFAFRLFGNIFAGEVLLTVMAFLMPFIAPLPFLMLELFVGFIQALVFSTLTTVFVNVAVSHEEH